MKKKNQDMKKKNQDNATLAAEVERLMELVRESVTKLAAAGLFDEADKIVNSLYSIPIPAAPAPAPDSRQAAILAALDDDPTAFHAVAPAPAPSPAPASPSVRGALWRLLKAIDNDDGVTKDCGDELNCARQEGRSPLASQTPQACSMDVKKDASEIVRRLTERNPDFVELIKDGRMSLVNFAEIVIVQFLSFNPRPAWQ